MSGIRLKRRRWSTILIGILISLGAYLNWPSSLSKANDGSLDRRSFEEIMAFREKRFRDYKESEGKRTGPGEMGKGVHLPGDEQVRNSKRIEKEGFNVLASEKIALDRSLRDNRDHLCREKQYPPTNLTASVVIIYYNEEWTAILRTVHSVVNRSPARMLKEVVLLDDSSNRTELGQKLHDYVDTTWPDGVVKIARTPKRAGLIGARIAGAEAAEGDVLVFIDAHCEASNGWLEPLLGRIQEKRNAVLCPSIDMISSSTMQYFSGGTNSVGGFSWGLHFTWRAMPESEKRRRQSRIDPIRSPTMAGGLLAIERDYFWELGAYDGAMEIWGGENLEMSFRIWMCGGTLEFIPCSRVGHIFRATHPYGFPSKTRDYHGLNSKRLAEVWMDGYKRMFYLNRMDLVEKDAGDVSDRIALRKKLQCNDFKWYLDNVFPEKFVLDENVYAWGQLRNPETNYCLDTLSADEKMAFVLKMFYCQPQSYAQVFSLSKNNLLRRENTCAQERGRGEIRMEQCQYVYDNPTHWYYDKDSKQLRTKGTKLCLDVAGAKSEGKPLMKACNGGASQQWEFENIISSQPPEDGL